MWPFDIKRKRREAEARAEEQRQKDLAEARQRAALERDLRAAKADKVLRDSRMQQYMLNENEAAQARGQSRIYDTGRTSSAAPVRSVRQPDTAHQDEPAPPDLTSWPYISPASSFYSTPLGEPARDSGCSSSSSSDSLSSGSSDSGSCSSSDSGGGSGGWD